MVVYTYPVSGNTAFRYTSSCLDFPNIYRLEPNRKSPTKTDCLTFWWLQCHPSSIHGNNRRLSLLCHLVAIGRCKTLSEVLLFRHSPQPNLTQPPPNPTTITRISRAYQQTHIITQTYYQSPLAKSLLPIARILAHIYSNTFQTSIRKRIYRVHQKFVLFAKFRARFKQPDVLWAFDLVLAKNTL